MIYPHVVTIRSLTIGRDTFAIIAGPPAIESILMMHETAHAVADCGAQILVGGAFLQQCSPYTFQGLGEEGLKILRDSADKYGLATMSTVPDTESLNIFEMYLNSMRILCHHADIDALAKGLSRVRQPIVLTKAPMMTIDEFVSLVNDFASAGNFELILADAGIRSFDKATNPIFDLHGLAKLVSSAVFPVLVDLTEYPSTVVPSLARGALAAGSSGIIVSVHPNPQHALVGSDTCLTPREFDRMMRYLTPFIDLWRETKISESSPDPARSPT